jgi:D-inositol-3-phosphate glycosyltransferase
LAEVIDHERTGLVVPPENPAALAAAIERFFAEKMGEWMGKNVVGENGRFSWQRLVEQLEHLAATPTSAEIPL